MGKFYSKQRLESDGRNVLRWVLQVFQSPSGWLREMAESGDYVTFAIQAVASMIAALAAGIMTAMGMKLKYGGMFGLVNVSYLKMIIGAVFIIAIYIIAFTGWLYLISKIILKDEMTFCEVLILSSSKVFINSIFILIGAGISLLFSTTGIFIMLAGYLFSDAVFIMVYNEKSSLEDEKKIYAVSAALIAGMVVLLIGYKLSFSAVTFGLGNLINYSLFM